MLAPTLFGHGTEEQRLRILPKMASGEEIWAQAWSGTGIGQRPCIAEIHRHQDRRRLAAQRPEDLEQPGAVRRPGVGCSDRIPTLGTAA